MIRESKATLFLVTLLAATTISATAQAAENDFHARVVLFIPKDADPPARYLERLDSLAVRAESFFAQWMKHWERPVEREQIFARNEDGNVDVTLVRGQVSAKGAAALPEIRRQAVDHATQIHQIEPDQPVVWWILYDYPNVRGFRGGTQGVNGNAINAYPKGTELIGKDTELASPALAEMSVKGTVHEFGHALGLPHIGPRPGLRLGNSLMGPINRAYWGKTGSKDQQVHLSETAAAMLWKHPIFRRERAPDRKMPSEVDVQELKVTEAGDGTITISGKLKSDIGTHSAVVIDSQRGRFGDYWARPYASAIDTETGTFVITVNEPFDKGTIYLSFCFDNGVVTADGKKSFQRGSAVEIPYRGEKGSRQFF